MPDRRLNDQALQDTAARIERQRRHESIRTVIILALIIIALLLAGGLWLFHEISELIDGVHKQNVAQLVAIDRGQEADAADAAAQQEILDSITARLVPKSRVTALSRNVRQLTRETRQLQRQIARLNATLSAQGVPGGG